MITNDTQVVVYDLPQQACEHCKEWGATSNNCPCPVVCPACQRPTWPNLGVNLPAGAAVAVSCGHSAAILMDGTCDGAPVQFNDVIFFSWEDSMGNRNRARGETAKTKFTKVPHKGKEKPNPLKGMVYKNVNGRWQWVPK